MFVQRDDNGRIVGLFACPQAGVAEEWVAGAKLDAIPLAREAVERMRLLAYADPVSGSDRFKAEADAERLAGNEDAAAAAEQKLLARRGEIKAGHPWPPEG